MIFKGITPAQLTDLWLSVFVLLVAARLLGRLARSLHQPRVLGELLAGLLLGPSCLGWIWPHGFSHLFGGSQRDALISAIGWLGVILLLLLVGAEMASRPFDNRLRLVFLLAVGAVVLPAVSGFGLGLALPTGFIGAHSGRLLFAGFISLCITVSALPVIAKILGDLNLLKSLFGQITIAVGLVVDLIGWIAFSVFTSIAHGAKSSGPTIGLYLLGTLVFVITALMAGSWIQKRRGEDITAWTQRQPLKLVPVVVCVLLAMMVMANAVHLESIAGALLAGVLLGRMGLMPTEVRGGISPLVNDVLCPIFFATAGLKVDLRSFGHLAPWIAVIIGVAVISKYVGVTIMARVGRLDWQYSLAFASGLNARGAVEVIIAAGGLAVGILGRQAYSAIVVMAMITSLMAAPLLNVLIVNRSAESEDLAFDGIAGRRRSSPQGVRVAPS